MGEFKKTLLNLLGKEVYINCNFNYLLWDSEKPTVFTAQDYRTVIDLYNSYSHIITIFEPSTESEKAIINIMRY